MYDCGFTKESNWFRYRAAAIIVENNCVLFATNEKEDHLAIIHENFFNENNGALKGLNCHEICLYFLMKPRGTQELHSNSMTQQGIKEEMRWIPIAELDKYKAFPSFMKDYLSKEHLGIEHIVTDERRYC